MDVLTLCCNLFTQLNQKQVRYCHWKSNFHLGEALSGGVTDLDLLISSENFTCFEEIVKQLEFIELISPPSKRFPGMSDYLGFDEHTGKLVHLHVHKKLILGQRFIKNHHLPIEGFVLDHCRLYDGVMIPSAEMELLLLLLRAHMKLQVRDLVLFATGVRKSPFPLSITKEFEWLIEHADMVQLEALFQKSNLPISFAIFRDFPEKLLNNNLSILFLLNIRKVIFSAFKVYQRDDSFGNGLTTVSESFKRLPVVRRLFSFPRKTLDDRGIFFAIVGADGSGKSTLVNDLVKWLSWKLEVRSLYFGIPKFKMLRMVNSVVQLIEKMSALKLLPFSNVLKKLGINLACCRWLWIAKYRYRTYKKAKVLLAKRGAVCIADRYPLKQFWSMSEPMDGPRMQDTVKPYCKIADKEKDLYLCIKMPDMIFILQADFGVLRARKNDLLEECHQNKVNAVNKLEEGTYAKIIDVNLPYDKVLLSLKRSIWKQLSAVR